VAVTVLGLCFTAVVPVQAALFASAAQARSSFSGPLMGWSSWSVESSTRAGYGKAWLTEQNIKNAADSVHSHLQSAGYDYIDIDAGWDRDSSWNEEFDGNGIPSPDPTRFPDGISGVASYIHGLGLKVGLYVAVGLAPAVYNANDPIAGTSCTTQQIAVQPLTWTNGWDNAYEIDYSNPCAQAYINSIVDKFASWGVDMIKVDGITRSNVPDVQAYSQAIDQSGRQMWLTASAWPVPLSDASGLSSYANSVRVDSDVECYCSTTATWSSSVSERWSDLPNWLPYLSSSYLPDLDSMPINNNTGSGLQDGINDTQRQSVMNFWSMASAPLYVGGDVYFIDSNAVSVLTNPEVIAVDQSSVIPYQVTGGTYPVWAKNVGGSTYVAVYNLSSSSADITVDWSSLGLSGSADVRDVDAQADLGTFSGSWTAVNVPPDGSRLIKVTPQASGGYPSGYHQLVIDNDGLCVDVYGNSSSNGAAIDQWGCKTSGQGNQEVQFLPVSNGYGELQVQSDGKDIVVQGASKSAGAWVIQYTQNGTTNGLWLPVQLSDGTWQFKNDNSGLCLDVYGGTSKLGQQLDQWYCKSSAAGTNQGFRAS
jgi:hypothetical protein